MGWLGDLKGKLKGKIEDKIVSEGAEFAGRKVGALPRVSVFIQENRKAVLAVFAAAAAWAWEQDCGIIPILGYNLDILLWLQQRVSENIICINVQRVLEAVAAFFVGASIAEPDQWIKAMKKRPKRRSTDRVEPPQDSERNPEL